MQLRNLCTFTCPEGARSGTLTNLVSQSALFGGAASTLRGGGPARRMERELGGPPTLTHLDERCFEPFLMVALYMFVKLLWY